MQSSLLWESWTLTLSNPPKDLENVTSLDLYHSPSQSPGKQEMIIREDLWEVKSTEGRLVKILLKTDERYKCYASGQTGDFRIRFVSRKILSTSGFGKENNLTFQILSQSHISTGLDFRQKLKVDIPSSNNYCRITQNTGISNHNFPMISQIVCFSSF